MIALDPWGRVVVIGFVVFLLLAFGVIPGLVHTFVRRNREDDHTDTTEHDDEWKAPRP